MLLELSISLAPLFVIGVDVEATSGSTLFAVSTGASEDAVTIGSSLVSGALGGP